MASYIASLIASAHLDLRGGGKRKKRFSRKRRNSLAISSPSFFYDGPEIRGKEGRKKKKITKGKKSAATLPPQHLLLCVRPRALRERRKEEKRKIVSLEKKSDARLRLISDDL